MTHRTHPTIRLAPTSSRPTTTRLHHSHTCPCLRLLPGHKTLTATLSTINRMLHLTATLLLLLPTIMQASTSTPASIMSLARLQSMIHLPLALSPQTAIQVKYSTALTRCYSLCWQLCGPCMRQPGSNAAALSQRLRSRTVPQVRKTTQVHNII